MHDPTFHYATMARNFQKADFRRDPNLIQEPVRAAVIVAAVQKAQVGFQQVDIASSKLRNSDVYRLNDISEQLILRHINRTIRRITRIKQSNRTSIVNSIIRLSEEGLPFRIYKLDIASFYESIDPAAVIEQIRRDGAYSSHFSSLLRTFFACLTNVNILGLPRGLAISATLSEILMRDFDREAMLDPRVHYYARFVDDIIIITSGKENAREFLRTVRRRLLPGISFNSKKTRIYTLSQFSNTHNASPPIDAELDYLGYKISIHHTQRTDRRYHRKVRLDLSEKKEKRIKSRLYLSFAEFRINNDFTALLNRVRMLCNNFHFIDVDRSIKRKSGIFFNYPLINLDASEALPRLDRYLHHLIVSHYAAAPGPGLFGRAQREALFRNSFVKGYREKRFFHFPPSQLAALTRCWRYA
ncbi:MAG: RNA-directed DNA polymerase [Aquamicrobium sp.]|uniref:antiviral reverse transcriptase Drt3a n=1 Tax=Aquamicrobium sp. TaxID=1872579 RepID=UPI00349E7E4E|nr:RNA-directed DNA polymerase [Aquamicrobium sp.]